MKRQNREIILFFEENEYIRTINGKIVRLYMNRLTINEEEPFEIAGLFDLAKIESKKPEVKRRKISSLSSGKWNDDWTVIENAFGKLDILNWFNVQIHIFMGTSSFIDDLYYRNSLLKLINFWAENCCSSISISFTNLSGQHDGLRTKVEVKDAYQRKHIQDASEILRSNNEKLFHRLQDLKKSIESIESFYSNKDLENFVKEMCAIGPDEMIWQLQRPMSVAQRNSQKEFFEKLEIEAKSLQDWVSPLINRFDDISNDTLNNDLEDFIEDLVRKNDNLSITETPIERKLVLYKMLEDDHHFMKSTCKRFTVYLK